MTVIDAGAAVRSVLDASAGTRLAGLMESAELFIAPHLFVAEVTNAIWRVARANAISGPKAQSLLKECLTIPEQLHSMEQTAGLVLSRSMRDKAAAYDYFYFELALQTGSKLFTADKSLAARAEGAGVPSITPDHYFGVSGRTPTPATYSVSAR